MPADRRLFAAIAVTVVIMAPLIAVAVSEALRIRTITVDELRAGTAFDLAGVRFTQAGFDDLSPSDGPIRVTFRIEFPDGAVETLVFGFDGFCASGTMSQVSSVHRAPTAIFAHSCAQDFIRVWVS